MDGSADPSPAMFLSTIFLSANTTNRTMLAARRLGGYSGSIAAFIPHACHREDTAMLRSSTWFAATTIFLVALAATAQADGGRKVIPLDGVWQIAEGTMDDVPKTFDRQAPVPGLADMARPAFEGVGVKEKDPRRQAFWYRRTLTVAGAVPAVAMLKIHKACYGTCVYLNGQPVGEHAGCFTPGCFDLRNRLKGDGQANELVVRVGASRTAVGEGVPWGHDFEKVRYIPGIYDSVELILAGAPHIVRVQAVPDVPGKRVRLVALVRNPVETGDTAEATLRCTVREAKTQKVVGSAQSKRLSWKPGEEQTLELSIPIEDCRLWSPEDPFLYEADVSACATGNRQPTTDNITTRFGMRSFSFDPATKRAVLNGKPYFLRGTNICIYRFFEDPLRGDKPWREEWVRRVIRGFRSMNWNSARYCIGFPPEMWYRIADEEGLMIQDEFPVWGQTGSLESLSAQYAEWMRERWNHPSVVIWDAQNETADQDVTSKALMAVRKLDLSNRPWDNGWAAPQGPTDVYEAHPYRHINNKFRMAEFARMSPKPGDPGSGAGNPVANRGDNPIIINEYGWLWLNRDGTPCTLPVANRSYQFLLPPDPTPDQYRMAYARTMAAKTEFWRCGRKCAGVMHFCGLGYSRPGGQTSDNFIDLERPTIEPHFFQYVRDAFAPVGLMIDFWADECQGGTSLKLPVVVINDLDLNWQGPVTLCLARDGKTLAKKTRDAKVAALGREVFVFEVAVPPGHGKCRLVAELRGAEGQPVRSLRDFSVVTAEERSARRGIAIGCRVTASSNLTKDGQRYPCEFAVDGDATTRWSSEFSDPQWLAVDLGKVTKISRVELEWEAAFGKSYAIQVSSDGKTWIDVYKTAAGAGGSEVIRFPPTEARWVRYYGTGRGTQFGHSIWELRVFP
jgi:beta-galactosidase